MTHDKRNLTEPLLDIFADRLHDLPQREALKGWHASPDPLAILAIGSEVIELRATVRQASPEEANDPLVDWSLLPPEDLEGWHASPDTLAILTIGNEVIELRATVRQASPEEANDLLVD